MLSLLIQKELKHVLHSPKFTATFLVCSILIIISVFVGINEYSSTRAQYEANQEIARQNISEATSWGRVSNIAHREPVPMQIFVSGLHFDVGRLSNISTSDDTKLIRSPYSDEPLFAIFRMMDFAFIVQVVLSLFAIVFTYDAINGEREQGTLKLAFANSISRAGYLFAKFCGLWLGLIVPLLVPIMLSLLMVLLFNIPLSKADWGAIAGLIGLSVLYITLFMGIGILFSSITRTPALSFLLLLVIWIGGVLILPRIAIMTAGQLVPVESIAQLEAKQEAFQKQRWDQYSAELTNIWQKREAEMEGMNEEERSAYRKKKEWEWREIDEAARKKVQADIIAHSRKLLEETQNRKKEQERLALTMARFSPVSSFRLAAMNLAGTDLGMKTRYEESMRNYKDVFTNYIEQKEAESRAPAGIEININSDSGVSINFARNQQTLDTSEMPQYVPPSHSVRAAMANSIFDFGLLILFIILSFGGSFLAFLKYDMR